MIQRIRILFSVLLVVIVLIVAVQIFTLDELELLADFRETSYPEESQFKSTGDLKCDGKWMKTYKDHHAKSLRSSSQARKYLIYYCTGHAAGCGGYGNRMFGIISTFYLAVVTDRTFLIHWGGPERLETFLKPNMIDWTYDERKLRGLKTRYTGWRPGWRSSVGAENSYDRQINADKNTFGEWFQNVNIQSYFDVPVEKIMSIWNFAPRIWNNFSLMKRAKQIGIPKPRKDYPWGMIGCAMKFLFKKTKYLVKASKKAKLLLGSRERPIIGIHIRTSDHHFRSSFNERSYRTRDPLAVFACAQRVENALKRKNHILKNKTFTWFLATDNRKVKLEALRRYPNNVVTLDINPLHIEYGIKTGFRDIFRDLLLDQLLLMECDYFLPTWDSTFSYMVIGTRQFLQKSFVFGEKCNLDEGAVSLSSAIKLVS